MQSCADIRHVSQSQRSSLAEDGEAWRFDNETLPCLPNRPRSIKTACDRNCRERAYAERFEQPSSRAQWRDEALASTASPGQ